MTPRYKTANELIDAFVGLCDCEPSLADLQWLKRNIADLVESKLSANKNDVSFWNDYVLSNPTLEKVMCDYPALSQWIINLMNQSKISAQVDWDKFDTDFNNHWLDKDGRLKFSEDTITDWVKNWMQQNSPLTPVKLSDEIGQYPDTDADGFVFCGKCGKAK